MRKRQHATSSIGIVLAASLGAVALGCQAGDLEALDARAGALADAGAVEGTFVIRIADMLDGTSRRSHHVTLGKGVEYELAARSGRRDPAAAIAGARGR